MRILTSAGRLYDKAAEYDSFIHMWDILYVGRNSGFFDLLGASGT